MSARSLRDLAIAGFLYGSLAYGGVLAILHLVHNRVAHPLDGLIVSLALPLLYGLPAALTFTGAGIVAALAARLGRRSGARRAGLFPGLFLGLSVFNGGFALLFWLYGMTYDQVPLFRPAGPGGMLAFLAVAALVILAVTTVVSWWLAVLFERVAESGRGSRVAATGYGALAAATLIAVVIGALAAGATPATAGATAGAPAPEAPAPVAIEETGLDVVLVGLDGADWQVLGPRLGELPAFSAMVEGGASGELATLSGANSAVIWASIYTGMTPAVHGVHDFYRIALPGMRRGIFPLHRVGFKEIADRLEAIGLARRTTVSRYSLAVPPLWEIVNHLELPIGVVDGYYYSFPALVPATAGGFFLAYGLDGFAADLAAGRTAAADAALFLQPKEMLSELAGLVTAPDFYWQSATLLELLGRRERPRLVNLYTHQPDSFQHWYWKWLEPRYYLGVEAADLAAHGDEIPKLYRDFDAFLARLRTAVGPETVVIVASDHGHAPTLLHGDYHTQHRHGPPGIVLLAGGPVKPGWELEGADVYDLMPTVLYLLGLPVPEDAAGRVLVEALDEEFVRRHPVRSIPTYRGRWPDPFAGDPGRAEDRERQRRELDKLRALGYI